jgi:periplasmic protein TonB
MSNNSDRSPDFNDIVFENRNKEYGAYKLRKKYNIHLITGLLIGLFIISIVTITPYLKEKSHGIVKVPAQRSIVIRMQKLDIPKEEVAPPPPPPPMEPHERIVQPQKYVAPQVVDTIMPQDTARKLMTAEEAKTAGPAKEVVSQTPPPVEVTPEANEEPFTTVQEMPQFPGGNKALMKYIAEHTIYPSIALENNIQGRVIVKFCVTAKGAVSQVSILRGVSPELNDEAIRVVKSFPKFIPGKQSGIPVPVWYVVPITFSLK